MRPATCPSRRKVRALSDFVTNRTGFVVLHPLEGVSGAPVEVEHVDGSVEQSRFPELIDPTCPFMDIRALTHEPLPGLRVACRMEGDTFEMEDQRNWLDASYKTYVRPLALPWPYTIAQGEKLSQRISLAVDGQPARSLASGADVPVTVTVGARRGGRECRPSAWPCRPSTLQAALGLIEPLRALGPAHLVAEFDARKGHDAGLAQDLWRAAPRHGRRSRARGRPAMRRRRRQAHRRSRGAAARPELREGPDRARGGASGADRGVAGQRPEMHPARQRLAQGAPPGNSSRGRPRRLPRHPARRRHVQLLHRAQPQAAAGGPVRLRRPHDLPAGPRLRRPLADRGAGGAALHHQDHALVRWQHALLAVSFDDRACARTPTAPRRPRTRRPDAWRWRAPIHASTP